MVAAKTKERPPKAVGYDDPKADDTRVERFTQLHLQKWKIWAEQRLHEFWPYITAFNVLGILLPVMSSNSYLFIKARRALLLAVQSNDMLDQQPIVDIVFCFRHDWEDEDQLKDVRLLFRAVDDWARSLKAKGVRVLHPDRIDMTLSRGKEVLFGKESAILLKDLEK